MKLTMTWYAPTSAWLSIAETTRRSALEASSPLNPVRKKGVASMSWRRSKAADSRPRSSPEKAASPTTRRALNPRATASTTTADIDGGSPAQQERRGHRQTDRLGRAGPPRTDG